MKPAFDICIVIPAYNESKYFLFQDYATFLNMHDNVLLCFVNDGSTDGTADVLTDLYTKFPKQVEVLSNQKNLGKAETVRKGMLHCNKKFGYHYIAFLDADLATPLQECLRLTTFFTDDISFCFGSRILKIGSVIERKKHRFLIGRVVATIISNILSLKVYDTQCGCKLFTKELSAQLFHEPFISKWLFDVELFFRMMEIYGKQEAVKKMIEVPLNKWVDRGKSKVKFTYFFRLFLDLYSIKKKYKKVHSQNTQ